jgi:hypothetical protein
MPTVFYKEGYRFFFYSNDHLPMHIHVEKENKTAKFNLEPLELVRSSKFNAKELREIRRIISASADTIKNSWDEYFDNK